MRRRASWLRCSRLRSLDYPSRGSPDHGQQNSRYRRNEARRVGLRDSARAKFVLFQYCISIVILTFRRPSDIYFLRQGENSVVKGLPFTLLSLVGGASRGGRFARFSPSTTIRAAEKTLRNPWSIHCGRKPPPRQLPRPESASSARPPHRVNYWSNIIDGEQNMGLRKPKSIKHNGKSLVEILEAHERFFTGKDGGARADLTGADLSHADLSGVNLSGAILRNSNLEGSDLRKAKLPGADLSNANLHRADLRNTDMTEAILPGADLTEAQASGVEFFRCDLSNVNFQRAQLRNVNLRLANVSGAKFSGADMGVAILRETDLTGADLSGVDLSTALLPKGFPAPQAAKKSA